MKYSFAIGIPTLNRADLLNPTLEKYFQQFPDVEIFIVNNGDKQITSRSENFTIHKPDSNYGVAKSWNYLCDQIFKDHEYALILNDDIEINLNQDELNNFLVNQKFDLVKCEENFHLCSFALSKQYFSKERFDESFYPAYFEDRDYLYRLKLNKGKMLSHRYLNPSKFINSATISPQGGDPSINKNYHQLRHFYMQKWGGMVDSEIFSSPFNKRPNQDKIIEIISVTYDHGYKLKCFIDSIRSQSSENWRLNIIHDGDGELFQSTKKDLEQNGYLDHPNIYFTATKKRYNDYGHSLRGFGLNNPISDSDYTVITNCDNYYVPEWISILNNWINKDFNLIVWDCVHNHIGNIQFDRLSPYGLCISKLKEGSIDMGAVAIKTKIAQKVGFKHSNFNGDWNYFSDCLKFCEKDKIGKIPSILFVHN